MAKNVQFEEMENLITVKISPDGKRFTMVSKYGTLSLPVDKVVKAKQKSLVKAIANNIIPKINFVGMDKKTYIFSAPKGWKGGVNA